MDVKRESIMLYLGVTVLFIISYFIIESFIVPLLFTFLLVYILYPYYKVVQKVLKFHLLTSLFVILSFLFIMLLPPTLMIVELSTQLGSIDGQTVQNTLNSVSLFVNTEFGTNLDFHQEFLDFLEGWENFVRGALFEVPQLVFQLFLIIFFYYYFSKEENLEFIFFRTVLKRKRFIVLRKKFKELLGNIIYGQIFVRFIQALVGTIGLLILGVPGAFFLGIAMFFSAFLPIVGTGLVWFPVAILQFLQNDYTLGVSVLILGTIISFLDNILLPHIMSKTTRIGPVIILVSMFGGLELFGFYGLVLGPFFLGALFVLIEETFAEIAKKRPEVRKYVWTAQERKKFRTLKTEVAREEYIKIVNAHHEKFEKQLNDQKHINDQKQN